MSQTETISAKQAATSADTHDQAIRRAVRRGLIRAHKKGGRLFIVKESFDEWRKRLEVRRGLRLHERELAKT